MKRAHNAILARPRECRNADGGPSERTVPVYYLHSTWTGRYVATLDRVYAVKLRDEHLYHDQRDDGTGDSSISFRRIPREEGEEIASAYREQWGESEDVDGLSRALLHRSVTGWTNLIDAEGNPIPFDLSRVEDVLDLFCDAEGAGPLTPGASDDVLDPLGDAGLFAWAGLLDPRPSDDVLVEFPLPPLYSKGDEAFQRHVSYQRRLARDSGRAAPRRRALANRVRASLRPRASSRAPRPASNVSSAESATAHGADPPAPQPATPPRAAPCDPARAAPGLPGLAREPERRPAPSGGAR